MELIKSALANEEIRDLIDSNGCSEEFTAEDVCSIIKERLGVSLASNDERIPKLVELFNQPLYFQAVAYASKDDFDNAKGFCASPCCIFAADLWKCTDIAQILEDNYAVKVRSNDGEHSYVITQDSFEYRTAQALKEFNLSIRERYVVVTGGKVGAASHALERAFAGNLSDTLFHSLPGYKCLSEGLLVISQEAPDSFEVSML